MTATLEAPMRMKGRSQAIGLVRGLGALVPGDTVDVQIPENARPTTSFLAQLISSVAVQQGATLQFVGLEPFARRIVEDDAENRGVLDLVKVG